MATKGGLLEMLESLLRVKEAAIPLCARHINSTVFLSGFDGKKADRIEEILNRLSGDSKRHTDVFRGLIASIEGEAKDVY